MDLQSIEYGKPEMNNVIDYISGMSELIHNPDYRGQSLFNIIFIERFIRMTDIDKLLNSLEKLNPDLFTYDNYCMNTKIQLDSYRIFNHRDLVLDKEYIFIGWTDGKNLRIRPRPDSIAFMIEDKEGEKFWFHFYIGDYREWKTESQKRSEDQSHISNDW